MAIQVATVTLVVGQAWLKQPSGERLPLKEGMTVSQGDEIVTGDGSTVRLQMAGSDPIYIGSEREFLFGSEVVHSDLGASDAALHGLDSATTGILSQLLGSGADVFTAIQSLRLLSDNHDGASTQRDAYASDPTERSTDNLIRLLDLLETTDSIADRAARIADPSRPLVEEFPHTVPNDGRLSSDRFDHQGPDNAPVVGRGLEAPSDFGLAPFPAAFAGISVGSITSDNTLNLRESRDLVLVAGRVSGDAKAGDTVMLSVGENVYQTVVASDGAWSVHVPGSALEQHGTVHAAVTASNGAASVTATASRDYDVDTNPPNVDIRIDRIDPAEGGDAIGKTMGEARFIISGTLDYEAGADITVSVKVNGKDHDAVLDGNGRWSISVTAAEFGTAGEVYAMATATDAAGNSASTSVTHDYALNTPPVAAGGTVQGVEDTALVLDWSRFNVSDDSPATEQGIVITGLPADGMLQFNTAGPGQAAAWTRIELSEGRYEVSGADIEAGRLRFVPDAHESGWDGSAGSGVGDQQADYARISYRPSDGEFEGAEATLRVDIVPVADAPVVGLEVGATSTVEGAGASYGLGGGIVLSVVNGTYAATGLEGGRLLLPPFAANTGGNINPNDAMQGKADIIALVGDFDTLVAGRDGNAWQPLHGINGENRDYVFLSKPHDRYELTNATYNQGFLNGRLTDLDTGLSINLNNVKGLVYGDGHSVGGVAVDYQAGESYDLVALQVHAGLVDRDGSETLSGVTLTGIPEGVAIEGAQRLADGSWFVANADGLASLDLSLVLRVPAGTEPFTVTASASASEQGVATVAVGSAAAGIGGGSGVEVALAVDAIAGDGVINAAEAGAPAIAVSGTVTADVGTSTTVTVTVNGQEYTATVDALNGRWTAEVSTSDLLADSAVSVNATSTDAAGNSTTVSSAQGYSVDITAPRLSVSVDPITSDNVVNAAESGAPIGVTGKVAGEFNEGDAVTLTVNGVQYTATVDAGGLWTIAVAGSDLVRAGSLNVSVTTTDDAGNSTTVTAVHGYSVDTVAPELTVSVNPVTVDNTINAAEAGAATIAVTGTIAAEAGTSTAVMVTVNGQDYVASVDAASGTWTAEVSTSDLLADSSVAVSATSIDAAGNSTTVSSTHGYSIDTTAPDLTISVDSIASDNVINAAESGESVDVTGKVVGEFNVGDTVTLTVNSIEYAGTVAADGTWTMAVPGADLASANSLNVSVTTADDAGNSTTATAVHGYSTDTAAPELTVSVHPVTADNTINAAEAGAATIAVTGTIAAEAGTSTAVTITINGHEYTATVDTINGTWTADVATDDLLADSAVSVSATSTDVAGNRTTATAVHGYSVDTESPELEVSVDPITSDNVINAAESGVSIDVTGKVGGEFSEGDAVTLAVNGAEHIGTVDAAGLWTISVPGSELATVDALSVSVTTTDAAGNSTTATAVRGYGVDVTAPELTVSVNPVTADNTINAAESGESTIAVTGTIVAEAGTSTTVTITVNGQQYAATVDAAAGTWTTDVATSDLLADNSVAVSAVSSDAAGNSTTATATHGYGVDTTPPELVVTIDPISGDGYLDRGEAASAVTVTGRVSGEVTADTAVRVTVGGHVYEATLSPDGSWSVPVAGEHLAAADSIQATATATDAAGNSASDSATQSYEVQPPNEVPVAADGAVQGVEDTALVLDWDRFNVSDDSPAAEQGIVITGLPADGVLQFNTAVSGSVAVWTQVELAGGEYQVSRADIEAGRLRFVPDDHESGGDAYGGSGVGDQQADYAHIVFRPTDGENTGEEATLRIDIAPVADAPEVNVTLARIETDSGPAMGSEVLQVNGGSGVPGGFDVQDGKIVKIGEGVRVWLTEGDAAPEAANPAEQIRYYTQGNQGGDANYADIYVVHSQSGWFYRQSDWAPDRKELRKLDSVGGNRESNADGDKDYIFVQREDGYSYSASHSTNNNDATHVNTLDGVRVSYTGPGGSGSLISQVSNNLEGVIFGNGSPAHLADSSGTTFETVAPSSGVEVSYEIAISAAVTDTDGSEFLGDLLLAGIPAGATVSAAGALPEGLSLVQAGQDWALRWDAGAAGEARQAVDVVLEVRGVPEDAAFNGVTVSTEAHEANGSVASASGSAVLGQGDPGAGSEPEAPGVPGDGGGDPGTGGEDGEGGGPVGDIPHSGTDLLVNGDFSQLANANEYGWSGNNDQGYTAWTHTGPFLESTWRMTGSSHSIEDGGPYVGAWNNDARDITLSQHVSGVPAGSVLQLDVAWNNPNNGIPGDPWNAPKDTGNGMRLEISFGGVVYAVIATPEAGVPVDQAGFATVTAMNGAAVSIDRIETWSHDYSTDHGNDDFHPRGLTGFQTLQIQLPADAPETGSLTLHWDPQSEGSQYTDDLMVANLHLYAGDGTVQPLSSPLVDGGLPPEAGAPGGDGSQPPAGADEDGEDGQSAMHVLAGTPGNDVFEWSLGDGGVTHDVIRDFGTGEDGRGRDVLDLRDLLDGEQNGELTQYLHFSTALNDQGQADTVIHVQTQGGLAADGSGYNHQITIENVDLVGAATDQAQLIQNLIQEGRLRVDQ